MHARDYIRTDVADHSVVCEVYRSDDEGAYNGNRNKVGEASVYIYGSSSTHNVVTEGTDNNTSLTGLKEPLYDQNNDIVHEVQINDELRVNGRRYHVETKDPLGGEMYPDLWQLGLSRASDST